MDGYGECSVVSEYECLHVVQDWVGLHHLGGAKGLLDLARHLKVAMTKMGKE